MRAGPIAACLAVAAAAACSGDASRAVLRVDWRPPELRDRAAELELRILEGGCRSTSAVHAQVLSRARTPVALPRLAAGTWGFALEARDASCTVFARGCTDASLPDGDGLIVAAIEPLAPEVPGTCAGRDGGPPPDGAPRDGGLPPDSGAPDPIEELAAGQFHTCVRRASGAVWCWGRNDYRQLGAACPDPGAVFCGPQPVPGIDDAITLAPGALSTCVLRASGRVACWGSNEHGQGGIGSTAMATIPPTDVPDLTGVSGVVAGKRHVCARTPFVGVLCWGANEVGQLGDGTTEMRPSPTPTADVLATPAPLALTLSDENACVARSGGEVWCWGANGHGQLGTGAAGMPRLVPAAVDRATGATQLVLGHRFACARDGGTVRCWGNNDSGELGGGVPEPVRYDDVAVAGVSDATSLTAAYHDACVIRPPGRVSCWGWNEYGQLGNGAPSLMSDVPVDVLDLDDVTAITLGGAHACALRASGQVWCWGQNDNMQLGDGTTVNRARPVRADTLPF